MKLIKYIFCLMACALAITTAQAQTNRLVIPDIEAAPGKTVQIPVNLENSSEIIALQFDLTLPSGITAEENDVTLTARSENHTVTAANIDGKLRILVFSPDNTPIRGNSGALLYINATIPGELIQGSEHQMVITDPILSDTNIDDVLSSFEAGNIVITPSADLVPRNITVTPATANPGDQVTFNWTVENIGSMPTTGGWREQVYVLKGDNLCLLGTVYNQDVLAAGGVLGRNLTIELPEEIGVDGLANVRVRLTPNSDCGEPISAQGNNTVVANNAITLSKQLFLTMPESRAENGSITVRCTLQRSGNKRLDQTFNLAITGAGDPGRISVPATVTIPYGKGSAFFDLTIVNDAIVNNSGDYTITATGNDYTDGVANIKIIDDEKPHLYIELPEEDVTEGDTFIANVSIEHAPATDLTIGVYCTKTSRFSYPSTIVLPAGQTATTFEITAVQNLDIQTEIDATFKISAEDHLPGEDFVTLVDDDIPAIELTVTPTTVNENAGFYAMEATLRRTNNLKTRATIRFSDTSDGALYYDKSFTLDKGVQEAQFNIGVIDDANVNGERNVTFTAAVSLSGCSCNATEESGGKVSVNITILDDDGPALSLNVDRGTWIEGGSGTLTVSHNTVGGFDTDMTVNVTSDYDSMLNYEHSVVIPAHQNSVQVPVTVLENDIEGDSRNVTFNAQCDGFTKGVFWVQISDQTLPDAIVNSITFLDPTIYAGVETAMKANIGNNGYAALPDGTKLVFYNAATREAIGTTYLSGALEPGSNVDVTLSGVVASNLVGELRVYAEINSDKTVNELSNSNNRSTEVVTEVVSPITLLVDALNPIYTGLSDIVINGTVSSAMPGAPIGNVDVDVYIINNSYRKVLSTKSDAEGRFQVTYTPNSGDIGVFTVGACYPNEKTTEAMTTFQIGGLKRTSSEYLKAELATNEPMVIPITVKNPSQDIAITNLRLRRVSVPEDVTLELEPVGSIAAGETTTLNVTITGTIPSEGSDWIPCIFALDNDQDCPLSLTIYEYTRNRLGALSVSEKSIRTTMNIHTSRTYPLTITNVGRGNTGKISVLLPSWIKSETPTTLPSLAENESTTIILRLEPDASMTANIPVIGQLAINCENANGVTIPFNITPVSELTGNLKVNVCDEYTYYTAEKPMVKDARVQLRNGYTNTLIEEYNTGNVGYVLFSDIPEGYYSISITAPNHDSFRQNVIVNPGETTVVEALISFQAITVEWDVEETEVEDEYEVVTTVRFVTNVPKPVLVIDIPKKFDLFEFADNSRNLFYVGVTNEGLISATRTLLGIPKGEYRASDGYGNIRTGYFEWQNGMVEFTLAPKQTRFFPVYFVVGHPDDDDIPAEAPSRATSRSSGGCTASFDATGFYLCGGSDNATSSSASASIGTCSGGGGTYIPSIDSSGGGGLGGPSISPVGSGSASSSTSSGSISYSDCNSCGMELAKAMTSCAIGFTKMGCAYGIASTAADIAENGFDPGNWKTWTNIALTIGGCVFDATPLGTFFSAASCAFGIATACDGGGAGAPARRTSAYDDDDEIIESIYNEFAEIEANNNDEASSSDRHKSEHIYIPPELSLLKTAAYSSYEYYQYFGKF